jgi:hypothetical protein
MRKINKIHLHCSASTWGSQTIIDDWHKERGWSGCGYHFVICNGWLKPAAFLEALNGQIEIGRDIGSPPSSIKNHNEGAIAICLIGDKEFSNKQFTAMTELVLELIEKYELNIDDVVGHYELYNGKTCPNFSVEDYRAFLKGEERQFSQFVD